MKRARYQHGSLSRVKRKTGGPVWEFRWYEGAGQDRKRRNLVVGTIEQFPTESAAQQAVDALRLNINHSAPRVVSQRMSFGALAEHYIRIELPKDSTRSKVPKAHSTRINNTRYLRKWIMPRWESKTIEQMPPIGIEDWLFELKLANGSKAKIRNLMSAVFRHAIRHGFLPRNEESNPIRYVRQSAQRQKIPVILSVEQLKALFSELQEPFRTMAILDASSGLRISELLALKWEDIDFENLEMRVHRAIVYGVVGDCKTEASKKQTPLDPDVATALLSWRLQTAHPRPCDWVFASPATKGRKPLTPQSILRRQIQPAAERANIEPRIGWHTFRHTFATLLKANGEDLKVVQELLRHANYKTTADIYAQGVTSIKREAQSKVVRMFLPAATA